jgi:hypothetical protein
MWLWVLMCVMFMPLQGKVYAGAVWSNDISLDVPHKYDEGGTTGGREEGGYALVRHIWSVLLGSEQHVVVMLPLHAAPHNMQSKGSDLVALLFWGWSGQAQVLLAADGAGSWSQVHTQTIGHSVIGYTACDFRPADWPTSGLRWQ